MTTSDYRKHLPTRSKKASDKYKKHYSRKEQQE